MIIYPYFKITNLDFINEKFAQLEKGIEILSKEKINDLIKEIFKLAQHEYFEIATLQKLLARIQEKKKYYENFSFVEKKFQQRIHNVQKKLTVYRGLKDLWKRFDPLQVYVQGSTWSLDEYDSYIFPVFKLLEKNVSFDELYQHVQCIIETHMEMENYNKTKIAHFVHDLQKWHKDYKERRNVSI